MLAKSTKLLNHSAIESAGVPNFLLAKNPPVAALVLAAECGDSMKAALEQLWKIPTVKNWLSDVHGLAVSLDVHISI